MGKKTTGPAARAGKTRTELFRVKESKRIPFDFVLDELDRLGPVTRPMFGCTAVYVGDRIVFILRDKGDDAADNGVWIATTVEHHASLREELPSMQNISVLGSGVTGWQNLPSGSPDFEDAVLRACALVRGGDPRIGKIPASKKTKAGAKRG